MASMMTGLISERGRRHPSDRDGFTLIEVLLVAAIMGLLAAVTVPSAVRSMQGNRLRVSARTIVMSGKYASSMALLQQRDFVIRFEINGGLVTLHRVRTDFRSDDAPTDVQLLLETGADEEKKDIEEEAEGYAINQVSVALEEAEISRQLDRVIIESFELENPEDEEITLPNSVRYFSNGTCTPYSLTLLDESGEAMLVTVDPLCSAETERL